MRCPDCDSVDRRQFLKTAALGTAGAAVAAAVPKKLTGSSETLVTTFYTSLSPEQRTKIVFPFDHPLRSKVDNNWYIVPQKVGKFYTADQQAMIEEIFRGLHNPDFVEKVLAHMKEDSKGVGLPDYTVALFGEPGAAIARRAATAIRWKARLSADPSSMGTRLALRLKKSPIIRTMCTGFRPSARTRCSRR